MIVELAIGDAYGAGCEYAAGRIVREKNNLSGYIPAVVPICLRLCSDRAGTLPAGAETAYITGLVG